MEEKGGIGLLAQTEHFYQKTGFLVVPSLAANVILNITFIEKEYRES